MTSTEMVARRAFLHNLSALALLGGVAAPSRRNGTINISLYVDNDVTTTEYIDDLSWDIHNVFEEQVGLPVTVGPVAVVDAPTTTTARELAYWWRDQRKNRSSDANLLLTSFRDEAKWQDGYGWAFFDTPYGVCGSAELMRYKRFRRNALHEIGHMFGLRHAHGNVYTEDDKRYATVMFDGNVQASQPLRFSDESIRRIKTRA